VTHPHVSAPERRVMVKALSDERGFDVRRARAMRAAWKELGHEGDAQAGHLGDPHAIVRAGLPTAMAPRLAIDNLRDKHDLFQRGARASAPEEGDA
jgi:hypothetical protein